MEAGYASGESNLSAGCGECDDTRTLDLSFQLGRDLGRADGRVGQTERPEGIVEEGEVHILPGIVDAWGDGIHPAVRRYPLFGLPIEQVRHAVLAAHLDFRRHERVYLELDTAGAGGALGDHCEDSVSVDDIGAAGGAVAHGQVNLEVLQMRSFSRWGGSTAPQDAIY